MKLDYTVWGASVVQQLPSGRGNQAIFRKDTTHTSISNKIRKKRGEVSEKY